MSLTLLIDTAKILEASGSEAAYDFPGWESTEHVLEFLKAEIKKASVESAPLRAFLVSAGVDEHQLSEAVPPPPRGVLLVDEVFDASVAPNRPFVRCGDCGIAHWRPEGADRIGAQFNCSCGQRLQLRSLRGRCMAPPLPRACRVLSWLLNNRFYQLRRPRVLRRPGGTNQGVK